jgi:hypothetical protein
LPNCESLSAIEISRVSAGRASSCPALFSVVRGQKRRGYRANYLAASRMSAVGGNLGRVHYLRLRTSRKEFVHALEDLAECRVVIGRLQQQNDGDDEGELKERKSHEGPDHSGEQPDHPMVAPGIGCVA